MDQQTREAAQARLKRIAGQVSGIQRMVNGDRHCVEILWQVAAAQAALLETGRVILAGHVDDGLAEASRSGDEGERRKKIDELVALCSRFCHLEEGGMKAGDAAPPP